MYVKTLKTVPISANRFQSSLASHHKTYQHLQTSIIQSCLGNRTINITLHKTDITESQQPTMMDSDNERTDFANNDTDTGSEGGEEADFLDVKESDPLTDVEATTMSPEYLSRRKIIAVISMVFCFLALPVVLVLVLMFAPATHHIRCHLSDSWNMGLAACLEPASLCKFTSVFISAFSNKRLD